MFERAYRKRLDADLARWQADAIVPPAVGDAIRASLTPLPPSAGVAIIVAIVGGLLIAAAFLAFIAANWSEIARPARFAILLVGIAVAYAAGAYFTRESRWLLADVAASVGTIIFGAAIALVGQMYHLGDDFAGGLMIWSWGAMAVAVLTGSRGCLAAALAIGCGWSGGRMFESADALYLPFIPLWLLGAALAVIWNSPVARHLVGVAAVAWLITGCVVMDAQFERGNPVMLLAAGGSLLFGAGLFFESFGPARLRGFGLTLSSYGAFVFAATVAFAISGPSGWLSRPTPPGTIAAAIAGFGLAGVAAAFGRRVGPLCAALAIGLGGAVVANWVGRPGHPDLWLGYALSLAAMLFVVVSGVLDDVRTRTVAGWLGLALVIAIITWGLQDSLLHRAAFLAVAGAVAIGLALALGRLGRPRRQEDRA